MGMYKHIIILLIMYSIAGLLLFRASERTPYLLPIIWFTALILLICGLCYIYYQYEARRRGRGSREDIR